MAFKKYAKSAIQEVRFSPVRIEGNREFNKLSSFDDYQTDDGYIYTRVRAISSRVNKNYDGWPSAELEKAYRTFLGKPIFVDHHNDNHQKSRGVIVDANIHVENDMDKASAYDPYYLTAPANHKPPTWIELLLETDARAFPKLAHEIVSGGIDSVSMGANVEYSDCSICQKRASAPHEYCEHVRNKGAHYNVRDSKTGSSVSKLAYEDCGDIGFFEISYVFDPADTTALISDVKTASVNKEAINWQRLLGIRHNDAPEGYGWTTPYKPGASMDTQTWDYAVRVGLKEIKNGLLDEDARQFGAKMALYRFTQNAGHSSKYHINGFKSRDYYFPKMSRGAQDAYIAKLTPILDAHMQSGPQPQPSTQKPEPMPTEKPGTLAKAGYWSGAMAQLRKEAADPEEAARRDEEMMERRRTLPWSENEAEQRRNLYGEDLKVNEPEAEHNWDAEFAPLLDNYRPVDAEVDRQMEPLNEFVSPNEQTKMRQELYGEGQFPAVQPGKEMSPEEIAVHQRNNPNRFPKPDEDDTIDEYDPRLGKLAHIFSSDNDPDKPRFMHDVSPDPVDTLRDIKPCKLCGSDMENGKCDVCGYEQPPDSLDDPDLTKAQEIAQQMAQMPDPNAMGADPNAMPPQGGPPPGAGAPPPGAQMMSSTNKALPSPNVNSEWQVIVTSNTRVASINKVEKPILAPGRQMSDKPASVQTLKDYKKPVQSNVSEEDMTPSYTELSQKLIKAKFANDQAGVDKLLSPEGFPALLSSISDVLVKLAEDGTEGTQTINVDGVGGFDTNAEAGVTHTDVEAVGAVIPNAENAKHEDVEKVQEDTTGTPIQTWTDNDQQNPVTPDTAAGHMEFNVSKTKTADGIFPGDDAKAEKQINLENPIGKEEVGPPTKTWPSDPDYVGDPITSETFPNAADAVKRAGIEARNTLLAAFKIADEMIDAGLITEEQRYDAVAELEQQTPAELAARHDVISKMKTANVKVSRRSVPRLAGFDPTAAAASIEADADSLFM